MRILSQVMNGITLTNFLEKNNNFAESLDWEN